MILKASERGGARQLALHLLNSKDNEHVEVHEVSGFMSHNLVDAMHETYAISKGTHCKKFLFSLSLSPPENEYLPNAAFEDAIKDIEQSLKLKGQPRAIVFHEKEGRRHCHVVWSRIDSNEMKAINLPFFKKRLMEISQEQYIKHGIRMPRGFKNRKARNRTNAKFAEHQQAKRKGKIAKHIKYTLQGAWESSDNKQSFEHALRERGYWLARGDRRGFVIIDHDGEIYSAAKWLGIKTKDVRQKIGNASEIRSVSQVKAIIAHEMTPQLLKHLTEAKVTFNKQRQTFLHRLHEMTALHQHQRAILRSEQTVDWTRAQLHRQHKFAKGLSAVWERVSGQYRRIRQINKEEASAQKAAAKSSMHDLRSEQLVERRKLQVLHLTLQDRNHMLINEIQSDLARHVETRNAAENTVPEASHTEPVRRKRHRRRRTQEQELDI